MSKLKRDAGRRVKRPGQKPPLSSYFGPDPVPPARSIHMSRIRGRDTGPELELRSELWRLGVRFRTNVKSLPGRPDIANQRAKVVVFVDGCFWHGCPRHFKVPRTRAEFWSEKIARNRSKRKEVAAAYDRDWKVVEVFECALGRDLAGTSERIAKLLESGRGSHGDETVPRTPDKG
jgi:DNA mismatch endonuclease, patch repair protein